MTGFGAPEPDGETAIVVVFMFVIGVLLVASQVWIP